MAVAAIRKPAAEEDASCSAAKKRSKRKRSRFEREPMHLVQHQNQPGLDSRARHGREHEETKEEQHGLRQQELAARWSRMSRSKALLAPAILVLQNCALPKTDEHRGYAEENHQAKHTA